MQIWQTLEHVAYWNIYEKIFYDDTVLRNICQHIENCGKPRSLHPTWCHQNQDWVNLWHVLPETWTELQALMQEEERHNLHETSKDGWRHSTPRASEVVVFPWYNNVGIEWYGRMPADPLLVDPKSKKPLEPSEGEDVTLEATDPMNDSWTPLLRWVGMYSGIRVILCLSVRLNIWKASLEGKGDTLPPWLHS